MKATAIGKFLQVFANIKLVAGCVGDIIFTTWVSPVPPWWRRAEERTGAHGGRQASTEVARLHWAPHDLSSSSSARPPLPPAGPAGLRHSLLLPPGPGRDNTLRMFDVSPRQDADDPPRPQHEQYMAVRRRRFGRGKPIIIPLSSHSASLLSYNTKFQNFLCKCSQF